MFFVVVLVFVKEKEMDLGELRGYIGFVLFRGYGLGSFYG